MFFNDSCLVLNHGVAFLISLKTLNKFSLFQAHGLHTCLYKLDDFSFLVSSFCLLPSRQWQFLQNIDRDIIAKELLVLSTEKIEEEFVSC